MNIVVIHIQDTTESHLSELVALVALLLFWFLELKFYL